MRRIAFSVALTFVVAAGVQTYSTLAAPSAAGPRLEWSIRPVTPPGVTANTIPLMTLVSLHNVPLGRYLGAQNGAVAMLSGEVMEFRFVPAGSGVTVLRYLFLIAIRSRSGRYLKAGDGAQPALVLSDTPSFEWIVQGGQSSQYGAVPIGATVAIGNITRSDQLVSCPNAAGGLQVGWAVQCGASAAGEQPAGVAHPRPLPSLPSGLVYAQTPAPTPVYPLLHPGAVQWEWRAHRNSLRAWLFNSVAVQYLVWGARVFGVYLEWTADNEHLYFPSEFKGQGDRILYRSPTALRMGLNYLKYAHQSVGINLGWSGSPVYDWEIQRDGTAQGEQFPAQSVRFALYNRTERDYLVYCERPLGINLRWLRDCPSRYPAGGGGAGSSGPSGPTRPK